MSSFADICKVYGKILGGNPQIIDGTCFVFLFRNVPTTILGQETRSPYVQSFAFSFGSLDCRGRSLNTSESGMFEGEVNSFVRSYLKNNVSIAAMHKHWIFDRPSIMYIHAQSIENPIRFALKAREALQTLRFRKFQSAC
ncbi:DUF1259 domain-containing protein [Mechercharimyces sp. CAU 1602]|uniref:DUF1259 domain-containing protein n=1 Tax=Mechercharimyces sp. CAU 1602 TaxID=2973933 RepID=UPI0021626E11|nr:DUF1259 domain-containing protein [Mechercharimyces sp. CAU 1602]MCS1352181.1 DUF1259 domain-containing protein [Mechercharimyces sp. CAU 1602]